MSNYILTPNMSLPNPIPETETGPQYAKDIQSCFSILDTHNHAAGSGVQINPAGININSALPFNGNNIQSLNLATFNGAVSGTPANLSVYSNGTDFFYKDSSGNAIQLTKSGGPNAGTGNIQNLPSTPSGGAGISWVNSQSTFAFLNDSGTGRANLDSGSLVVRYPGSYPTPSGNYVSLQAPSSLSSGYALFLPAIPSVQSIMSLDTSGNISAPYTVDNSTIVISSNVIQVATNGITATQIANNTITRAQIAALGQQVSSSSGNWTGTNGTSYVSIPNLSVTLTTHGEPVSISLISDGTSPASAGDPIGLTLIFSGSANNYFGYIELLRDGTAIAYFSFGGYFSVSNQFFVVPFGTVNYLDNGATAGSHTYTLKAATSASSGIGIVAAYCQLAAYELL